MLLDHTEGKNASILLVHYFKAQIPGIRIVPDNNSLIFINVSIAPQAAKEQKLRFSGTFSSQAVRIIRLVGLKRDHIIISYCSFDSLIMYHSYLKSTMNPRIQKLTQMNEKKSYTYSINRNNLRPVAFPSGLKEMLENRRAYLSIQIPQTIIYYNKCILK